MKIKANDCWPFFTAYNKIGYIKSHDTRKIVVLKDPGESREYRLENESNKELVVYSIDGSLINDNDVKKCDFGIFTEDNELFLIELKGKNLVHAIDQLASTINILLFQPQVRVNKLNVRIVVSKVNAPDILTTKEKAFMHYCRNYKLNYIKKCKVFTEKV